MSQLIDAAQFQFDWRDWRQPFEQVLEEGERREFFAQFYWERP